MTKQPDRAEVPYANLDPAAVLAALDSLGFRTEGRLLALNSYENRVYQAWIEDAAPVVVKFYRPARWSDLQIVEEHRFTEALASEEIPVVTPLAIGSETLHRHAAFRLAVYARRGGRAPDLERFDTLEWLGRLIGRIHMVGSREAFHQRPRIDIHSFGEEPRDWLLANQFIPGDLVDVWKGVATHALSLAEARFADAGDLRYIRLHGDCHAGNVLWTDDGPLFLDFDDARMGPAVQDLWMLLSGDRAAMTAQLEAVLKGYERFHSFEARELYIMEALRTLRLLHYSAWLARRWSDPAFPAAFPWFNTQRYWQDRILELREQIALMQEPPLALV